jgi:hypothetical protein
MTSFAKYTAVLAAALIATTAVAEKLTDDKSAAATPAVKKPKKKDKKDKPPEDPEAQKKIDVPVVEGHPSKGLYIPYFANGKRQMNFKIAVATRLDVNHIQMDDLQVETFNDDGEHDMDINLPTAVMNTDTSVLTTNHHSVIQRDDFELTGETLIFNTRTKQGGLGGNVVMTIYNLKDSTSNGDKSEEPKDGLDISDPKFKPDAFKTSGSKGGVSPASSAKPDRILTPGVK